MTEPPGPSPKTVSRRGFLQATTAAAAVATGAAPAARRLLIEPYVRPPEDEVPGRASWFATTCRQCSAGCGTIVRVINGRPRKIEGNPAHPLNRGRLCARGQAGLQALYDPDRLRNAVQQVGGRGSRRFEPLAWSEAVDRLASALDDPAKRRRVAFLGGLLPEHLYRLAGRFLQALGASPPLLADPHSFLEGRAEAVAMSDRWFGVPALPSYDIARAEVVYSFGAHFLETWMSPVAQSFDFGLMRQGQLGGRGFLAHFEPRLSSTAAAADEWVPIRPGTEGSVALALGRIIVEEDLGRAGRHREHAHLYRDVDVAGMAAASGVAEADLRRLARAFANADRSVAIPGGMLAGHANVVQSMDAVMALNVIMRRLGREGGVFLPFDVPAAGLGAPAPASRFSELDSLLQRMRRGEVELLFIHGANPVYDFPNWLGVQEAMRSVPLIVSFSSVVDETAVQADLVLPDHTDLESWGFRLPAPAADRPVVSGSQPVSRPLYDTRSTADVLLTLASRLGGEVGQALPWPDEAAYLEEVSGELLGSSLGAYDARTPAGFWSRWRQFGGWWSTQPIRNEPDLTGMPGRPLAVPAPALIGDPEEFPFVFLPYPSVTLTDGRGANSSWLQEAPDPMTTACWNTWVEVNPATAEELGLENDDLVRLVSPSAVLEAPVVLNPGLRPDVIAAPLGQGHRDYGRFAAGRGSQPMALVAPPPDGGAGSLLWGATRVRLEPTGRRGHLARVESLEGGGRESVG